MFFQFLHLLGPSATDNTFDFSPELEFTIVNKHLDQSVRPANYGVECETKSSINMTTGLDYTVSKH